MYSTNNPFKPNLPQLQLFCLSSLLHLLRRKCIKLVSLCTYCTLSKLQGIKPSIRLCYHGYLLIKSTLRWWTFTTLEIFFPMASLSFRGNGGQLLWYLYSQIKALALIAEFVNRPLPLSPACLTSKLLGLGWSKPWTTTSVVVSMLREIEAVS